MPSADLSRKRPDGDKSIAARLAGAASTRPSCHSLPDEQPWRMTELVVATLLLVVSQFEI